MAAEELSIEELKLMIAEKEGAANAVPAAAGLVEVEADGFKASLDMVAAASYKAHRLQKKLAAASKVADATKDEKAILAASEALDEFYEMIFGGEQLDAIAEHITASKGQDASYEDVINMCNALLENANAKK